MICRWAEHFGGRSFSVLKRLLQLVHPIQPESPLQGCTPEQLAKSDAEFLILLRAIDDTFSQMVHTRYSYRFDEILWGQKFRPMFNSDAQGDVMIDLDQLDETDEVPLN